MIASRDAVLQTAELLQEILLQLDMRTLLTAAQLVSRQWHELIKSSPALRQALYLEPTTRPSGPGPGPGPGPATQNPLLTDIFPLWFPKETNGEQQDVPRPRMMIERGDFDGLPMAQDTRRHAFLHPSATWRRMLVQQPPALRLGHWTTCYNMMGGFDDFPLQEFPDGLRMGSLYDLSQKWLRQDVSGFRVFWDMSAATAYKNTRYDHRMEPEQEDEFRSFTNRVDVILFCHVTALCTPDVPDVYFEQNFTFAPSKEQQAEWDFLLNYSEDCF
ncbi:hypothetical protein F4859DRAFT_483241 [Xylaria cf. heliscus]|nr:hypothetical protein F4859DRAFT_483241 [Xylaria cf. heliscus]